MKIYIFISQWNNGDEFEGSVTAKAYLTLEEAQANLDIVASNAIESIRERYYDDYWEDAVDALPTHRLISDSDEYRDWWEGTIVEQEL